MVVRRGSGGDEYAGSSWKGREGGSREAEEGGGRLTSFHAKF